MSEALLDRINLLVGTDTMASLTVDERCELAQAAGDAAAFAELPDWAKERIALAEAEAQVRYSFHMPGRHDQKKHGRRGAGAATYNVWKGLILGGTDREKDVLHHALSRHMDHLPRGMESYIGNYEPRLSYDREMNWLRVDFRVLHVDGERRFPWHIDEELNGFLSGMVRASEPSRFHLAGRHDQKKHGRRGPGYVLPAIPHTGAYRREWVDRTGRPLRDVPVVEQRMFGRSLSHLEWQRLSGAPDGAWVSLKDLSNGDRSVLDVRVRHPAVESAHFKLVRTPNSFHMEDVGLFVDRRHMAGGIGFRSALGSMREASRLGVQRMYIEGGHGADMTGYKTWPRLGFDAAIPSYERAGIPRQYRDAGTVQELLAMPGGRAWWSRHGFQLSMEFDLAPGSESWRILNTNMGTGRLGRLLGAAEPYAFHLPGRHDQKKHGRRGVGVAPSSFTGNITLSPGYVGNYEATMASMLGRTLTPREIQRLTGVPDGGEVRMDGYGDSLVFVGNHHALPGARSRMSIIPGVRGLILHVNGVYTDRHAPAARSVQAVRAMMLQAKELGLKEVETMAAGARQSTAYTGYFTWPKLGFDGWLRPGETERAPHGEIRVLELMATPEGRRWWKRHGSGRDMAFDLAEGSPSWQALDSYMAESRVGRALGASEPSSFHLPGRHDQKKHGRRGMGYDLPPVRFTGQVELVRRDLGGNPVSGPLQGEIRVFGRGLERAEWQRLAGAPDGSKVVLDERNDAVWARVLHPSLNSATFRVSPYVSSRILERSVKGIDEVYLSVRREERRNGFAFRGIHTMLKEASRLGLEVIDIEGARGGSMTGYNTWPKLGFDYEFGPGHKALLPQEYRGRHTLQQLLAAPGGRVWWKKNGWGGSHMQFDLSPGSLSWEIYNRFMSNPRLARTLEAAEDPEAMAFHLPGRHDQKKHGRRGVGAAGLEVRPEDWGPKRELSSINPATEGSIFIARDGSVYAAREHYHIASPVAIRQGRGAGGAMDHVALFQEATGAVRMNARTSALYTHILAMPTLDQVMKIQEAVGRFSDGAHLLWDTSGRNGWLLGSGTTLDSLMEHLDATDAGRFTAQFAEALSFHLPGRHDQKKHGRRGAGVSAEQVRHTGDIHLIREVKSGGRATEEEIFGAKLPSADWQRLSGIPDGGRVRVVAHRDQLDVYGHIGDTRSFMTIYPRRVDPHGPVIDNTLVVDGASGRSAGIGFRSLDVMMRTGRDLGVREIRTTAVRAPGYNGYQMWPKVGFDGPFYPHERRDLLVNSPVPGARSVQELVRAPGGLAWWKANGWTMDLTFDLTPGSRSWDLYAEWGARRRSTALLATSEFEPLDLDTPGGYTSLQEDLLMASPSPSALDRVLRAFHLLGRHDQKKHGRRGPGLMASPEVEERLAPHFAGARDAIASLAPWELSAAHAIPGPSTPVRGRDGYTDAMGRWVGGTQGSDVYLDHIIRQRGWDARPLRVSTRGLNQRIASGEYLEGFIFFPHGGIGEHFRNDAQFGSIGTRAFNSGWHFLLGEGGRKMASVLAEKERRPQPGGGYDPNEKDGGAGHLHVVRAGIPKLSKLYSWGGMSQQKDQWAVQYKDLVKRQRAAGLIDEAEGKRREMAIGNVTADTSRWAAYQGFWGYAHTLGPMQSQAGAQTVVTWLNRSRLLFQDDFQKSYYQAELKKNLYGEG